MENCDRQRDRHLSHDFIHADLASTVNTEPTRLACDLDKHLHHDAADDVDCHATGYTII
jgi:hypothetical protein